MYLAGIGCSRAWFLLYIARLVSLKKGSEFSKDQKVGGLNLILSPVSAIESLSRTSSLLSPRVDVCLFVCPLPCLHQCSRGHTGGDNLPPPVCEWVTVVVRSDLGAPERRYINPIQSHYSWSRSSSGSGAPASANVCLASLQVLRLPFTNIHTRLSDNNKLSLSVTVGADCSLCPMEKLPLGKLDLTSDSYVNQIHFHNELWGNCGILQGIKWKPLLCSIRVSNFFF